ncbi:ATP-dependent RNA helicase ddx55, partial [Perkinsus olseni]
AATFIIKMEGGSYFRGTASDQDPFFRKTGDQKLMAKMKFPKSFEKPVDLNRINVDVLRPWVTDRITDIIGTEDEIVIDYALEQITATPDHTEVDPREMQLSLTGFLQRGAAPFCEELWEMLLSAQDSPAGVPAQLVDRKKREMMRKKEEAEKVKREIEERKAAAEAAAKKESESTYYPPPPPGPLLIPTAPAFDTRVRRGPIRPPSPGSKTGVPAATPPGEKPPPPPPGMAEDSHSQGSDLPVRRRRERSQDSERRGRGRSSSRSPRGEEVEQNGRESRSRDGRRRRSRSRSGRRDDSRRRHHHHHHDERRGERRSSRRRSEDRQRDARRRDDRTPTRRHSRRDRSEEGPESSARRRRASRSRTPPQSRKGDFRRDRSKGEGRGHKDDRGRSLSFGRRSDSETSRVSRRSEERSESRGKSEDKKAAASGYRPELSSGDLEGRKKVLLYRARQRGYLELDVILGSFADRYLRHMPEPEVDEFEEVLALENPDLYKWLSAQVGNLEVASSILGQGFFQSVAPSELVESNSVFRLNEKSMDFVNNTLGFSHPTPVQSVGIPLFLQRKDVACEAATGSGKTLAFVLPIMEMTTKRLAEADDCSDFIIPEAASVGAVILSPTRELATQIHDIIMKYIHANPNPQLKCYCFVGGRDIHADRAVIEGAKGSSLILVGTPGRVRHILCEKEADSPLRMKTAEVLVLDEADRLLALGFEKDMSDIFAVLPKQRRTCLFSATLAGAEIKQLVRKAGLRNPVHVKVSRPSSSPSTEGGKDTYDLPQGLENYFKVIAQREKLPWMKRFVEARARGSKVLVFFLTCASVDYHFAVLKELWKEEMEGESPSISLHRMHGHMTPSARHKAYKAFSEGKSEDDGCTNVMLATDLVARGVDIPKVDWIVQFDLPQSPSFFIHRVGRTARAGREGQAVACMLESEVDGYLSFLKGRGVSLAKWEDEVETERYVEAHAAEMLEDIRKTYNEKSRDFLDKAVAAFVSFVRGYSEHELSFVFNIKELDLGDVATSFSLLRLPRVKEIMGRQIANFVQSDVAPDSVAYSDATKEAARQERLKKVEIEREERKKRREKIAQKQNVVRSRTEKRECRRTTTQHELDSLQREEALVKKLKKGKISRKQFEHEMKTLDGVEDDDDDADELSESSSAEEETEKVGGSSVTKKRIRKDVLGGGRRKSKKRR